MFNVRQCVTMQTVFTVHEPVQSCTNMYICDRIWEKGPKLGGIEIRFFTDIRRHAYCLYSAQVSATFLSPFRRYTRFCCVYSMVYDLRNRVRNSTQK